MKLRNKLIPIAGVLATAAVVAPVAMTSCSTGTSLVDLSSGTYAPTQGKCVVEGNKALLTTIEDKYIKAIKQNPQIFAEDYYWSLAADWKDYCDKHEWKLNELKCLITDFSLETKTIKDESEEDVTVNLASYKFQTIIDYTMVAEESGAARQYNFRQINNVEFTNIPFAATDKDHYESREYKPAEFSFILDETLLETLTSNNIKWEMKFDYSSTETKTWLATGQSNTVTQKQNGDFTDYDSYKQKTYFKLSDYFTYSYYMSDITLIKI